MAESLPPLAKRSAAIHLLAQLSRRYAVVLRQGDEPLLNVLLRDEDLLLLGDGFEDEPLLCGDANRLFVLIVPDVRALLGDCLLYTSPSPRD